MSAELTRTRQARVSGSVVVGYLDAGQWSACFGLSYRDMLLRDALGGNRIIREGGRELRSVTGSGGIPQSRNKVAREFLDQTDGEWLLFLDTDMGFAPDLADRLVSSACPEERPIMGALCFAGLRRKPEPPNETHAERFLIQPTLYQWVELEDEMGFRPINDYPRDSIVEVGATGAATLLIHWETLASMRDQFGSAWFDPITHPTALKGGPRTFSEDMSFCIRAASVGLPIHVDTSIKTTHEKGMVYLDESTYDTQQAVS